MVLQENVTLIVTVCKLSEGGRTKCHKFWPDQDSLGDKNFVQLVEDIKIITKDVKKIGKFLE